MSTVSHVGIYFCANFHLFHSFTWRIMIILSSWFSNSRMCADRIGQEKEHWYKYQSDVRPKIKSNQESRRNEWVVSGCHLHTFHFFYSSIATILVFLAAHVTTTACTVKQIDTGKKLTQSLRNPYQANVNCKSTDRY